MYDSLRRLTSATNPESGTVSYGYDDDGNLITRTDARQITTSYQYDALNRLLKKTYPSGTPEVTYTYDTGATNGIGQLTQVSNSNSKTSYSAYDAWGRVTASSQITGGQTYGFSYTYNLAGAQTSETYPSGRIVNTAYDAANRVSGISTPAGGQTKNYVSNMDYWAHGALHSYAMGNLAANAPYAVYSYNSRLQMSSFHANIGNVENGYVAVWNNDFGTTDNNGNLRAVTERAGGPGTIESLGSVFQQSFTYDEVNRLKHAEETNNWSRDFSYDQYGNMSVTNATGIAAPGQPVEESNPATGGYSVPEQHIV